MTKRLEIYKCEICGNVIEVLIDGAGELVCCGKPMKLLQENTDDPVVGEKHVPVVVENDDGTVEVKVGSLPHPMTEEHYIMFVETISDRARNLKYLYPYDKPAVTFDSKAKINFAREYCNIHGLWRS